MADFPGPEWRIDYTDSEPETVKSVMKDGTGQYPRMTQGDFGIQFHYWHEGERNFTVTIPWHRIKRIVEKQPAP